MAQALTLVSLVIGLIGFPILTACLSQRLYDRTHAGEAKAARIAHRRHSHV